MALDPRLASVQLLTLAALRARQRAATQPGEAVVLQIVYDAYGEEPPLEGARHVLYLPQQAPSIEAWYQGLGALSGATQDQAGARDAGRVRCKQARCFARSVNSSSSTPPRRAPGERRSVRRRALRRGAGGVRCRPSI